MKEISYSIVIPHYNAPDLLMRCLASIPVREDIQVLVIDDCSPNSDDYLDRYPELKRPYLEFYKTPQGGSAGRARNIGLEHAKGKWLVFADADDYFYPTAFSVIDKKIENTNFDIVYFYCNSRDSETGELLEDRLPVIKDGIVNRDYDKLRYMSYVPWGKVVNHDIITKNNLKFDEVEVCNDIMFSTLVGYYSQNIGFIDDALYCCTMTKGSLFSAPSVDRIKTRVLVTERVNDFLNDIGMIKYRAYTFQYVFFFLPRHPFLFLWASWKCRYKDDVVGYVKIMLGMLFKIILQKVK